VVALLKTNSDFKNVITRICAIKNPNLDKLEVVATILLGVWDASSKTNVRIADFYQGCIHLNPNYIVGSEHVLPLDVESISTSIPGFSFEVQNSYINWTYNISDTGVIVYPVGSQNFLQWENELVASKPVTFEDLEPFLS
jgi:hypothetical protein